MPEQKRLILVIDDDAALLSQVAGLLSGAGYKTATATSGLEGLKQLNNLHPHLIILDINMPELDGMQTCRMIRATEKYGATPVLMLTARGEITDMMEARRMGANDYLVKPIDSDSLIRKVERLFSR